MKKEVVKLRKFLMQLISTNKEVAIQSLQIVYAGQTLTEIKKKDTILSNGRGFTIGDSDILTNMTKFYLERGFLSEKQMAILYKRLPKYWRQIVNAANVDLKTKIDSFLNS